MTPMKRTVGKTAAAGHQAGARKTLAVAPATLWRLVLSARGQRALEDRRRRSR
jgi:hypothetical protein